ncbi:MAG: alpha-galactosidase, partial [Aeoliella sp.]
MTTVGGEQADPSTYQLISEHLGEVTKYWLKNTSDQPMHVDQVTLHDWSHELSGETIFYGEGYTMLSQTGGTLSSMNDIGEYTDRGHYRLPEPDGFRTVYGMLTLSPPGKRHLVIGFSSCKRFVGKFHVNERRIQLVVDCEKKSLAPGQMWELEDLFVAEGPNRNELLSRLANELTARHPRLVFEKLPTGWCSWYCFGPGVTADNVVDNLRAIAIQAPELRYIQVDDGYQPWMGDWLETGDAFGGDVRDALTRIKNEGFEPAIWLAPFVASPESKLFGEHPDWFVQD